MNDIILVGNPNVGKTTLYNTMTKSFEKASNWHGVTVSTVTKSYNYNGEKFDVTDVPGLYSLSPFSNEEKIASSYVKSHNKDLVICICDANNLKRNIRLLVDLIVAGHDCLLALNMYQEARVNVSAISKILGVKVVEVDARKKASVDNLKREAYEYFKLKNINKNVKINQIKDKNDILCKIDAIIDSANLSPYKFSDKLDRVVTNKFIFLPIFLMVLLLVFYLTFGVVGSSICAGFSFLIEKFFSIFELLIDSLNVNLVVKQFLTDGVFGALLTIANFIPQIVLLMFFINLIEDIGLMSRVAFMFDGVLKKFGLTGKSLFSIMMGYGCTASAVMTTRNLENKNLRKRTALLLPFASCTAKLPVFLVIASLFFNEYKFLIVFALYIFSIIIGLIFAVIYKKFIPDKDDLMILEMPKYRFPNFKKILTDIMIVVRDFVIKVGTVILLFSVIVWLLQNFSTSFEYLAGEHFERSILYLISSKIAIVFRPIGLGQAGVVSAILLGLVAKEMVVVGLAMMNGVSGSLALLSDSLMLSTSVCNFTPISSIVFLVFVLLYSPCSSAIFTIKSELGGKTALYVFVMQFLISYLISWLAYLILNDWRFVFIVPAIILLDIIIKFVVKLSRKKKTGCRGNCNACRKL